MLVHKKADFFDEMDNGYLFNTLTLDPGDHSGWAYWKGSLFPTVGQFTTVLSKKDPIIEDTLAYQWIKFEDLLNNLQPENFFVEGVEFWSGSLKSLTAAKRQNLSKLSYLVGGFAREAIRRGINTRIIPASEWKGQTPNSALELKVLRINGRRYETEHILNAVGIGMSRMGLLQDTKNQPGKLKKVKERRWMKIEYIHG